MIRNGRRCHAMDEEKQNEAIRERKLEFESIEKLRSSIKDGTIQEILDDWKWIFQYSKRYKGAIAYYILLGILSTSLGLASSVAGRYVIDIITGYQTDRVVLLVLIMLGTSIFSILFDNMTNRISTRFSININKDIQADIFDQIVDADWMALNQFKSGDILSRFNGDINTVATNAIAWLPKIVLALYRFFATFFVIMHYDWIMAFIALGGAPLFLLVSKMVIKKQREYGKQARKVSSDVVAFEVETFYNFDTVKSFGIAEQSSRKLRWWQEKQKEIGLQYNLFSIKTNVYTSLVALLIEFAAFAYCLYRLWTHAITYGIMTLFLQQRANLTGAFNSMVSIIPSFLNGSISAHRIRELVDLPKETHLESSHELDALVEDGFSVIMEDLQFSYVEDARVISGSGMEAHPGEIVALVGPSGEGKTTMIRLMLGLIAPEEGRAVIRASSGLEVPVNAETRHLFSYVPQGNTVISGTIADNLRMAKEDATDEEIIEALKISCAWEFVKNMPEGINSIVRERGKGLSEGQAQRVAIARAILRDAPILLLDEATSALDVTTERNVLRNIMEKNAAKTCIVTTHRPSVLTMCQRVYRVVDTKVTELTEEEAARMVIDF